MSEIEQVTMTDVRKAFARVLDHTGPGAREADINAVADALEALALVQAAARESLRELESRSPTGVGSTDTQRLREVLFDTGGLR